MPPGSRRLAYAAAIVWMLLPAAMLALGAAMFLTTDVARGRLYFRLLLALLALRMVGFAARRLFWDAARSRRPRWQRTWAVVELLGAAYLVVLSFRGW